MTDKELALSLYDIGAIRIGDFTLASGKQSSVYIDLRQIISYPQLLHAIAEKIWEPIAALKPDLICGVPYTALPIATAISLAHNIPMVMVRKEAKTYGTKKLIEGVFHPNQTCMMIEDLVTTGGSAIKVAEQLKAEGLIVTDIAVLLDREQGGPKAITTAGFTLHAAFKITEIFSILKNANKFTVTEWEKVEGFVAALREL